MNARSILLCGVLIASACASATDEGGTAPDVRGTWRIYETRTSPAAEYEGELRIDRQNGSSIRGTIELAERDAGGFISRIAGVVSGRITTEGALDFDAQFDHGVRRHIGRLEADSLAGSWAEFTQPTAAGRFRARRSQP